MSVPFDKIPVQRCLTLIQTVFSLHLFGLTCLLPSNFLLRSQIRRESTIVLICCNILQKILPLFLLEGFEHTNGHNIKKLK